MFLGLTTEYPKNERDYAMGQSCPDTVSEQVNEMLDLADERGCQSCRDWEEYAKEMPAIEAKVEEKFREVEKLEQPRQERAMRLIEGEYTKEKNVPIQKAENDTEIIRAFGVCSVEIKGFSNSWLGSNEKVMEVLNKLPQIGLLTFESMRHTGKVELIRDSEGRVGFVAGEATPQKSGRVPIKVGEHHPDFFKEQHPELEKMTAQEREQAMQRIETETIVHEWAEGVWRELTTLEDRSQWRELHFQTMWQEKRFITNRASDGPKEDFGECCAMSITNPEGLKEVDKNKYNFIRNFLSDLEKESQWLSERFSKA